MGLEYYHKFTPPAITTIPEQKFLPSGKNIPWTNIKTGEVVYILSVGNNCFVAEDVIFGKNVVLMNLITITGNCVIGSQDEKTVIHDGVTVYADSDISGEITEKRIEAHSIVRNGLYVIDGKLPMNRPMIRNCGHRSYKKEEDPHYISDNFC